MRDPSSCEVGHRAGLDRRRLLLLPLALAVNSKFVLAATPGKVPRFEGRLVTEWDENGRTMTLLEPFAYIDSKNEKWSVPAKARVDGASIPLIFKSVVGGSFDGPYRKASVIHDWYCIKRSKPWKAVHRTFYEAMLTSGVPKVKARTMFIAVFYGGPRWDDMTVYNSALPAAGRTTPILLNVNGPRTAPVRGPRPAPNVELLKRMIVVANKEGLDLEQTERMVNLTTGAYDPAEPVQLRTADTGLTADDWAASGQASAKVSDPSVTTTTVDAAGTTVTTTTTTAADVSADVTEAPPQFP